MKHHQLVRLVASVLIMAQPVLAEHDRSHSSSSARPTPTGNPKAASEALEVMAGKLFAAMPQACRGKNLGVSPYNLSTALVPLILGGSQGLRKEFAALYGLTGENKIPEFLGNFSALNDQLVSSGGGASGKASFTNELLVLAAQSEKYKRGFIDSVQRYTGTTPRNAVFDQALGAKIDQWVSQATNQRIKSIAPKPVPSEGMMVFSASAFQKPWSQPFDKAETSERRFTLASGSTVQVPTMSASKIQGGSFFQPRAADVVELPYSGGNGPNQKWHAQIIMATPDNQKNNNEEVTYPTSFSVLEKMGTDKGIQEVKQSTRDGWQGSSPTVKLPKIEMDSDSSLCVLAALKKVIPAAFSSGITEALVTQEGLRVSHVGHKQFIKVDEAGTEAAAATAIAVGRGISSAPPGQITFDRPFIFIVRDPNGAPIFVQAVEDPSQGN